jgi:hypothetical protein
MTRRHRSPEELQAEDARYVLGGITLMGQDWNRRWIALDERELLAEQALLKAEEGVRDVDLKYGTTAGRKRTNSRHVNASKARIVRIEARLAVRRRLLKEGVA